VEVEYSWKAKVDSTRTFELSISLRNAHFLNSLQHFTTALHEFSGGRLGRFGKVLLEFQEGKLKVFRRIMGGFVSWVGLFLKRIESHRRLL
jgi:hypothetical protein